MSWGGRNRRRRLGGDHRSECPARTDEALAHGNRGNPTPVATHSRRLGQYHPGPAPRSMTPARRRRRRRRRPPHTRARAAPLVAGRPRRKRYGERRRPEWFPLAAALEAPPRDEWPPRTLVASVSTVVSIHLRVALAHSPGPHRGAVRGEGGRATVGGTLSYCPKVGTLMDLSVEFYTVLRSVCGFGPPNPYLPVFLEPPTPRVLHPSSFCRTHRTSLSSKGVPRCVRTQESTPVLSSPRCLHDRTLAGLDRAPATSSEPNVPPGERRSFGRAWGRP